MDKLPDHLVMEILSRLNDSTELARCKCISKTLNRLARQVRSIHLYCSFRRYINMLMRPEATPLLTILDKLISDAQLPIESVSLGMKESTNCRDYDYAVEDESRHNFFLTGRNFCQHWMTKIGHGLKSISICEFLMFDKETDMLEVLSYNCHSLVELTLGHTNLCAGDMHPMPLLTRLTLKDVCIGKSLKKLMQSLPCLQVFNFIDSICLRAKIHHVNLKELNWTSIYDGAGLASSLSIVTPNLTKLELELYTLVTLSIHAPLLSHFHLALERAHEFKVEKFQTLKTLRLVSSRLLYYILFNFPSSRTVQNLTFDSPNSECRSLSHQRGPLPLDEMIKFSQVFTIFPSVTSITFGSKVWSKQMVYPSAPLAAVAKGLRAGNEMKELKQITIHLVQDDMDKTLSFIIYIVGICSKLTDIVLFIHRDVDLDVAISFVLSCTSQCPKVRLRWGTWKQGTKDSCLADSIVGAADTG